MIYLYGLPYTTVTNNTQLKHRPYITPVTVQQIGDLVIKYSLISICKMLDPKPTSGAVCLLVV